MRQVTVVVSLCVSMMNCSKPDPCVSAVEHAFRLDGVQTVLGVQPGELAKAQESAQTGCRMAPWQPSTIACFANAKTSADVASCLKRNDSSQWYRVLLEEVDPKGTRRLPMIDPVIAEIRDAVALATPSDEATPCTKPLHVVAFDQSAARLIAKAAPPPQQAKYAAPAKVDVIVRYAATSKLWPDEIEFLHDWVDGLPSDRVWGFVETKSRTEPTGQSLSTFAPGTFEGVVHIVDPKRKMLLCRMPVSARSSDKVDAVVRFNRKTGAVTQEKPEKDMSEGFLTGDFSKQIVTAIDAELAK